MLIRRMQTSDVKAVAALARSNYDGVLAEYHSSTSSSSAPDPRST